MLLKSNAAEMLDFVKEAIEVGFQVVDVLGMRCTHLFPTLALDEDDWDQVRRDLITARTLTQAAGVAFLAHCIPAPKGRNAAPAAPSDPSHWTLGCYIGYVFTKVDAVSYTHLTLPTTPYV